TAAPRGMRPRAAQCTLTPVPRLTLFAAALALMACGSETADEVDKRTASHQSAAQAEPTPSSNAPSETSAAIDIGPRPQSSDELEHFVSHCEDNPCDACCCHLQHHDAAAYEALYPDGQTIVEA